MLQDRYNIIRLSSLNFISRFIINYEAAHFIQNYICKNNIKIQQCQTLASHNWRQTVICRIETSLMQYCFYIQAYVEQSRRIKTKFRINVYFEKKKIEIRTCKPPLGRRFFRMVHTSFIKQNICTIGHWNLWRSTLRVTIARKLCTATYT